jgi:polysaccharide export outer membrane protein
MKNRLIYALILSFLLPTLQGCAGFFASSGASRKQVIAATSEEASNPLIQVVQVTPAVARQVTTFDRSMRFPQITPQTAPDNVIGPGDAIEVIVWEAAPAILFRNSSSSSFLGTVTPTGTSTTALPAQMVNKQGEILFPFVGNIGVAGKTPTQVEALIVEKLRGKANQPQVLVRITSNVSSTVTVVGEVGQSVRMPLTPKGEKILDAIAAAGGVKQPVNKSTIQLTRNGQMQSLPMEVIIRDPKQNITLQPNDVITAYFQPLSFTVLGATGTNSEITFEAQGITLAQAMGRVGGLSDGRADSKGFFIFRYENPSLPILKPNSPVTEDNQVPVIYQFDLNDPATFFMAQQFPMKNKDLIYVATASSVELMKFLAIVTSVLSPAVAVNNQVLISQ